ncbi:MAG: hypothetical protein AAFV43_13815 [Planctomycetota bacterium]
MIVGLLLGVAAPVAGQFDAVLNWPADDVPTIIESNTQLNLLPGPRPLVEQIGQSDGLSTGIEVNLLGGSLDLFTPASGDVTINLHGSTYGSIEAHDGVVANYLSGDNALTIIPKFGAQVNLLDGSAGAIVVEGGETNISGGELGFLNARAARTEATINMTGGFARSAEVDTWVQMAMTGGAIGRLTVGGNGVATVEGGRLGEVWRTAFQSNQTNKLTLVGGQWEIDGTPIAGLTNPGDEVEFDLPATGALLSGVLSDGSPLALEVIGDNGEVLNGAITLRVASVPLPSTEPINLPLDPAPAGLRGETLEVGAGGRVGPVFTAIDNSTINLSRNGAIGDMLRVADTSVVNNAGGSVGNDAVLLPGATLIQTAGRIGEGFEIRPGATAIISGGVWAGARSRTTFGALLGDGAIELHGDEFFVGGVPISGLDQFGDEQTVAIPDGEFLMGMLADGTPISLGGQNVADVTLVRTPLVTPTPGQIAVVTDRSNDLYAARAGQTVEVAAGGAVGDSFAVAAGGELLVSGGSVGTGLEVTGGRVVMTAGSIADGIVVSTDGQLIIEGGWVDGRANVANGGRLEVSGVEGPGERSSLVAGDGGTILMQSGIADVVAASPGGFARVAAGSVRRASTGEQQADDPEPAVIELVGAEVRSTVRLSGGSRAFLSGGVVRGEVRDYSFQEGGTLYHAAGVTEERLNLSTSSVVVSGGVVSDYITLWSGNREPALALYGESFELDGVPIALDEGQTLEIAERSGTLSGVLSDGNAFEFRLSSSRWTSDAVHVHPDRLLTVTRVEQMQGDFNDDGRVDVADYTVWQDATASGNLTADANYDGLIDNNDLDLWRHRFGTDYSRLGDFNGDDRVDIADYTVWRDRRDPIAHLDELHLWRSRLGADYRVATGVSIPEPASVSLLALLMSLVPQARRRA